MRLIFLLILNASVAFADTPAPRSVESKTTDGTGLPITSTVNGPKRGLDCNISNSTAAPAFTTPVVNGSPIDPRDIRSLTTADQLLCGQLGSWSILNITGTVSLPTGASTSALQTAGNASLASIDTKTPALGQATKAGSIPVTIASDQGGLTVSLPTGASTAAKQDTGNASLSNIDGKLNTLGQKTSTNSTPVVLSSDQSAIPVAQSGSWSVTGISGTVSLPTGASTSVLQTTGNSSLSSIQSSSASIDGKIPSIGQKTMSGSLPVTISSNQSAVPASQSGVWNITNVSGTVSLPTGAATSSSQATGNASLSSIDSKLNTLGQNLMVNSMPVTIASNQSPIPISGTITADNDSVGLVNSLAPVSATLIAAKDTFGTLIALSTSAGGLLKVDGSGVTQPISASSLPLPTGAATSALQNTTNSNLTTISGQLPATLGAKVSANSLSVVLSPDYVAPISAATLPLPVNASTSPLQAAGNASLTSIDGKTPALVSGRVPVDGSGVTQPVSAIALPLPTGASTSALQTTGNASLTAIQGNINATLSSRATEATLSTLNNKINTLGQKTMANSTPIVIASDQAPIPITGSISSTNPSVGLIGSPVPLSAAQVGGEDPSGDLAALNLSAAGNLRVDGSGVTQPVSGTITANQGGTWTLDSIINPVAVTQSGTWNIADISGTISLPTGASTSALQTTGNSTLSDILTTQSDGTAQTKITDGTNTVVVTDADPAGTEQALVVRNIPSGNQTVSGTVTANAGTGTFQTNVTNSTLAVTQSGTWNVNNISGTVSLPTGASTSALQTAGNASLSSIDSKLTSPLSVTGPLTDTELRATPVPVNGTVAVTQSTSPWVTSRNWNLSSGSDSVAATQSGTWNVTNISGTVSLPTGASTSALQTTGNSTLSTISGQLPTTLGAKTTANSFSVNVASDQVVPVSASSLPLPAGASTAALQTTGNSSLSSIDGKIPSNLTVTATRLLTDGSGVTQPISAASLPLPSGASTSALQTTGNSSLSSIDTKTPALGQALAAASVPVVLTAAQLSTLTPLSTVAVTQSTSPWVVSGTVTANAGSGTFAVSAASLPLPSGASTSALQTTGNSSLSTIATNTTGMTVAQGSTTAGQAGQLQLGAVTTAAPTYTTAQSSPLSLTTAGALRVDSSATTQPVSGTVTANQGGTWNITNVSGTVSLPTGASTSALQTTGNSSLSSIDGKLTTTNSSLSSIDGGTPAALGQTTMSASMPVTLASDQSALAVSQSGTWNVNNISGTVSLPTGASTEATLSTLNGKIPSNLTVTATRLLVDGSGVTQPVSGTITANQGTSPWVNNISQFGGNNVVTGTGTSGVGIPRVTVANDSNILATQSGTWNINNVSGTVSLPTGASTSALQTTGNSSLSSLDTKKVQEALDFGASTGAVRTVAQLGNATGAAAFNAGTTTAQTLRVVLPTDQTSIPAAQSGTWNITNVSGTVSLPTGASTSALQTTGNSSLSSIDGKLNSLGQKTSANSVPVTIASDQSAVPASQSGTWTVQQGNTPTAVANAWAVKTTDGTNTQAVKAASTAAVAADPAAVVALSPNSNTVQGTVANSGVDSGNPVKIGGVYTATPVAVTSGDRADAQSDKFGVIKSRIGASSYRFQITAATVTLKTGAGYLDKVCLGTSAANGNTITVYDDTTAVAGSRIALLTTSGAWGATCLEFGVYFNTGLTFVTTGTSAWTIVYE